MTFFFFSHELIRHLEEARSVNTDLAVLVVNQVSLMVCVEKLFLTRLTSGFDYKLYLKGSMALAFPQPYSQREQNNIT